MSLANFSLQAKVYLQPMVLFHIIDSYERRPKDATQIMGTLLGRRDGKAGHIEITNCFTIMHKEHPDSDQIDLDLQNATKMYELNQLAYPQEKIVGWYGTGKSVSRSAVHLHEYYAREMGSSQQPLHLLVDTTLRVQRMMIRLYCAVEMGVPGGTKGLMFSIVPIEISTGNADAVALNLMQKQSSQPTKELRQGGLIRMLPELVQVVEASRELQGKLDLVLRYINEVLARKRRPDNVIGRALHDALTSVPMVDAETFRLMFNTNVRDMLMSITLSSMIKTQLQISEKLSSMNDH